MKDEELKLEEIEAPHRLGGAGRCYAAVIHLNTSFTSVRCVCVDSDFFLFIMKRESES